MPSPAMRKLEMQLANAKSRSANLARQLRKPKYDEVTSVALKVGGGALAGFVSQSNFNKVAGIDTPIIIGAALVGYGMFVAPKSSAMGNYASCLGVGMLSGVAYEKAAMFKANKNIQSLNTSNQSQGA